MPFQFIFIIREQAAQSEYAVWKLNLCWYSGNNNLLLADTSIKCKCNVILLTLYSPELVRMIPVVPELFTHVLAEFDSFDPLISALRLDSGRLKVTQAPRSFSLISNLMQNLLSFFQYALSVVKTRTVFLNLWPKLPGTFHKWFSVPFLWWLITYSWSPDDRVNVFLSHHSGAWWEAFNASQSLITR